MDKERATHKLLKISFFWLILAFLTFNAFNYVDADLGWHLRIGGDIITGGEVPRINQYNFTIAGVEWEDHEWLANVLMYLVYTRAGYVALVLLFALMTAAFLYWQNLAVSSLRPAPFILVASLQAAGILGLASHLGARVQTVGLIGFGWLVIWLARYDTDRRHKRLWLLPPLFWLWACLHGSFFLGLLVFAGYTLWPWVLWLWRLARTRDAAAAIGFDRAAVIALFLSSAATLLTPYGLRLYTLLWDYRRTAYMALIEEWLPFYEPPILYFQLIYLALAAVAAGLMLWRRRNGFSWPAWWSVLIAFTFYLALRSKRNFPLFYAVSLPWLAAYLTADLGLLDLASTAGKRTRFWLASGLAALALAGGAYFFVRADYMEDPFLRRDIFPVAAVEYMKGDDRLAAARLFNYYGWGGWLLWSWPEKSIFLDGRLPQEPLGGRTAIEEYSDFFAPGKTDAQLESYGIEAILFPVPHPERPGWWERYWFPVPRPESSGSAHYFIDHLKGLPDWSIAYQDDTALVYLRHADR